MSNELMIKESGAIQLLTPQQRKELFDKYILSGDVSGLSNAEIVSVVVSLCDKHGFDPMQRPFDVIELPGKGKEGDQYYTPSRRIIYANKTATAMIGRRDDVTVNVISRQLMGDTYIVSARAHSKSGRSVEDDGVVSLTDYNGRKLTGKQLENKMMHCTTKATRRAMLQYGGLGMMDESEVVEIEGAVQVEPVEYAMIVDGHAEAVADWTAALEGCNDCDALTKLQHDIQKQPDAVREALKEPKKQAMERIGATWRDNKFWPNAEAVEA